jgi:mitochondrial fission protein ELM1
LTDRGSEVWAVSSYRAGESSQIMALAEMLDVPWRRIDLRYRPGAGMLGLLRRSTPLGTSTVLTPPWPRLLISAGLKNEPVCRWVRAQSRGHTRVVFLGRTWAPVSSFDLVVTTPQYRLKPAPNLLENPLTLHGVRESALARARERWSARFGALSGRRVGVLLGGNSGPYDFNSAYAARLAEELNAFAAAGPVAYMISSSSRTPPEFLPELARRLTAPSDCFAWGSGGENPYLGILAWADELVVTSDSVAMISEALGTGKRVLLSEPSTGRAAGLRARVYAGAMRWGHRRWTRDVSLVHERLESLGLAGSLPGAAPGEEGAEAGDEYLEATRRRVRSLFY